MLIVLAGDANEVESLSVEDFAGTTADDLEAALAAWMMPVSGGATAPSSAILKSRARRAYRAARIVTHLEWSTADNVAFEAERERARASTAAAAAANAAAAVEIKTPAAVTGSGPRKVKISEVADVSRTDEVGVI